MADEHVLAVNGHKFKFGIRDIIQIGVTVIAALGIYFSMVAKTNKNADDITNAAIERGKMWAEIGRMNDYGTRHSHEVDASQQMSIDAVTKQIGDLSHDVHDLIPKVDKMDANLLWLMGKQFEKK